MYTNTAQVQVISCKKYGGIARHKGVLFLPEQVVAHCSPKRGLVVTSLADFLDGESKYNRERIVPVEERNACIERLSWAQINRPTYDLLTWNCEHAVAYITGQSVESPQLAGALAWTGAALLTAFVVGISRKGDG